jgi:hypothetical protein
MKIRILSSQNIKKENFVAIFFIVDLKKMKGRKMIYKAQIGGG